MGRRDRQRKKKLARARAKTTAAPPAPLDIGAEELEAILARARAALSDDEYAKLHAALNTLTWLTGALEHKKASLAQLRKILFGASTETFDNVFGSKATPTSDENPDAAAGKEGPDDAPADEPRAKREGHGRNGAGAYTGAERVKVAHPRLKSGDPCPDCKKGKVYAQPPQVLVRVRGQAPLSATVCERETFRCNLCGKVFVAPAPVGLGEAKYDATSAAMIALLRYGSGLPFHRIERLQDGFGIPLPAATQWDIVKDVAEGIAPAHEELVCQAAQGEVLHHDDTPMKILALMGDKPPPRDDPDVPNDERTGVFTSGIVSKTSGRKIALFYTGRKHAGENLAALLAQRAEDRALPIQMCDALSRNMPKELATIVANCLAHGRRRFVDVAENFPEACRHVLEQLREVYRHDAHAREANMTPEERLAYHQEHSGPIMDGLKLWFDAQFEQKAVEPNSTLGNAIAYMLKHWEKLTRFLQVPGAPLDNNICEIALKKAIIHRKNSLFYKTENGAKVGDLFMGLIYTAELADVSPFDYLTALQEHADKVRENPAQWMPWNYETALAAARA